MIDLKLTYRFPITDNCAFILYEETLQRKHIINIYTITIISKTNKNVTMYCIGKSLYHYLL